MLTNNSDAAIRSIVVRGSNARNAAVIGASDLDLVILTQGPIAQYKEPVTVPSMPDLDVETVEVSVVEFLDPSSAKTRWLRFNLAFCGWTAWGEDVLPRLPPPQLDRRAYAHLPGLRRWIDTWRDMHREAPDDRERRAICSWIMKRCVRSSFESIMLEANVYTRDIYPCARIAADYHPKYEAPLMTAAELAVNPVCEHEPIEAAVANCRPLLTAMYERHFV